jgi:RNA polymerase sigma-70 factor (ECF subfamily)
MKSAFETPRSADPGVRLDLDRALGALPALQRRAVEAIFLCGYTYEEAAELVEVPLGTLKRAQTRGLAQLRLHMQVAA